MRRWIPQPALGRWIALLLTLGALGASVLPASRMAQALAGEPVAWAINLELFGWLMLFLGLLVAAAVFGYRAAAALTLTYELDRNGLYITWLGNRAVVPLDQITSVDVGADIRRMPLGPLQRVGSYWGRSYTADERLVHLFTTRSPDRALLIHTPEASYAISPIDHESFVQDLEQRRNLGSTKPLISAVEPGRMFLYAFWADSQVRWLLSVAIALNLLALLIIMARYPSLAPMIELRFDATGQAAEIRPRHAILYIPLAALGLMLTNTLLGIALYTRQQLSARLLQGASLIVQLLCLVALATIIR